MEMGRISSSLGDDLRITHSRRGGEKKNALAIYIV